MNNENRPLISVCTITYNHARFVEQAIKSVLAQECTFDIEFVIGDDCSTDGTRAIIEAYHQKYPHIIKPLYTDKNLGAKANAQRSLLSCRGRYIASLEGDDYWIDNKKLQKQFDFMEAHPDFAMCYTMANVEEWDGVQYDINYAQPKQDVLSMADIITSEQNLIPTATIFFKNILPNPLPDFFINAISGDIAIHLIMAANGKIKYLPYITAVYRNHAGGITKTDDQKNNHHKQLMVLYEQANAFYNNRFDDIIKPHLSYMSKVYITYYSQHKKGIEKLRHVTDALALYRRYNDGGNLKEQVYFVVMLYFPKLLNLLKKNNG